MFSSMPYSSCCGIGQYKCCLRSVTTPVCAIAIRGFGQICAIAIRPLWTLLPPRASVFHKHFLFPPCIFFNHVQTCLGQCICRASPHFASQIAIVQTTKMAGTYSLVRFWSRCRLFVRHRVGWKVSCVSWRGMWLCRADS